MQRWEANAPRFRGDGAGHYESYFVRANHPHARIAFWLRYTVFEPAGAPQHAVGELWAIVFDGRRTTSAKSIVPISRTHLEASPDGLDVRIGDAILRDGATSARGTLSGAASSDGHTIEWDLGYDGGQPPLTLFPERWYARSLPKAKALVPVPLASFHGQLTVDGSPIPIEGWIGSQNHNWGSRHTDEYAWGQVAGFDDAPSTFLEISTARIHFGSRARTPWLTPMTIRHDGRELRLGGLLSSARATGKYDLGGLGVDICRWTFRSRGRDAGAPVTVSGEFVAPRSAFVSLTYDNPPGGRKTCHNTKVAGCRLKIARRNEPAVEVHTASRAAFEVLALDETNPLQAPTPPSQRPAPIPPTDERERPAQSRSDDQNASGG